MVWLVILGGNSAAHGVTIETAEGNILDCDLIMPVNVKAEARKSQFTRLLNQC